MPFIEKTQPPPISVTNLSMQYEDYLVMKEITFEVLHKEIFVIMGASGCGKSTLLKYMIGLKTPLQGEIYYHGKNFFKASRAEKDSIKKHFGMLFQGGALWSSMTLMENIALPLEQYTCLSQDEIKDIVSLKLSLVGLKNFEYFYPSQLSGGMRKRAGLARAMALDPDILFFDEPSAGLDPIQAAILDELILELRNNLNTTFLVVSHDLSSIFKIADRALFLDSESKTIGALGAPKELFEESNNKTLRAFLTRQTQ